MTRQVALADRTYSRLRRARRDGESFSAAIERLLEGAAKEPLSFPGTRRSRIVAAARMKQVRADRDRSCVDA